MLYELNKEYYVRSLKNKDLEGPYMDWFDDQDVCQYNSHGKFSKSDEYYKKYISTIGQERNELIWAICSEKDGHIGNVGLTDISFVNRKAEFGIIIGNKHHWSKGVAKMASQRILLHAFKKLNLNRVYCCVVELNIGMLKLANSVGMKKEGVLRMNSWVNGAWVNDIQFGIIADEFILDVL